ncbi:MULTISPECIES: response regulator [Sphaerospermopsis]|uniref:Response regulator receiver protein n=1 Tax=Sphaerospermopsis reniformis TaxID=531300 RepID=A0A480A2U8_9CYAN|nr:response regulator [Sphaerospermopsis reniformis]BAZ80756.1 response regulator receiver protein [Sphaerospermopsis kisseleviana NIES-73]GCL39187.1 response regulator receiver protein [Sphaerospermopsis reniformis]
MLGIVVVVGCQFGQDRNIIYGLVHETLFDLLSLHQGSFIFDLGTALVPQLTSLEITPLVTKMAKYELCRRLKSDPKTQNVPVVICSSKGEEFDRYWGMRQGADAYIAKPFQPTELVGTVKQLLRG